MVWQLIQVHNDATQDLLAIRAIDNSVFIRLVTLIEQLKADPKLIDKLLEHGFGNNRNELISVMKWINVQNVERLPVWRMKSWDLERLNLKYRLIYFYNWPDKSYNIMAIIPRDGFDYDDPNNPIRIRVTQRIKEEFPNC